ncbi:MAG: 50S ribosomal protein L6 [Tenericutes bacterium]|nr:MAG: 50S ribosomal protein L6 [Mycoplasmatota bacterium]
MSRIGRRTLPLPQGVEVKIEGTNFTVKGPKGELSRKFDSRLTIANTEEGITVTRPNEDRKVRMLHGTTNSLIQGMIEGVTTGFVKELKINGVGYGAKIVGTQIELSVGFSHKVLIEIPTELKVEITKNTEITVSGIDKQQVTQFAAIIKRVKKPEPYGGKGIMYKGQHVIRKAGKAAK